MCIEGNQCMLDSVRQYDSTNQLQKIFIMIGGFNILVGWANDVVFTKNSKGLIDQAHRLIDGIELYGNTYIPNCFESQIENSRCLMEGTKNSPSPVNGT